MSILPEMDTFSDKGRWVVNSGSSVWYKVKHTADILIPFILLGLIWYISNSEYDMMQFVTVFVCVFDVQLTLPSAVMIRW
jgi:hypothetical protein